MCVCVRQKLIKKCWRGIFLTDTPFHCERTVHHLWGRAFVGACGVSIRSLFTAINSEDFIRCPHRARTHTNTHLHLEDEEFYLFLSAVDCLPRSSNHAIFSPLPSNCCTLLLLKQKLHRERIPAHTPEHTTANTPYPVDNLVNVVPATSKKQKKNKK